MTSCQDAAASLHLQQQQAATLTSSSSSSPGAWLPASKCWHTLGLMGPLRDSLVACVGEPRHTAGAGSHPRLSPAGSQLPKDQDLKKLLDATSSMASTLAELRALLLEQGGVPPARQSSGADAGTGGASTSEAAAAATASRSAATASAGGGSPVGEKSLLGAPDGLKEEIGCLQKEVVRLEAQAVRVDDLEQVAAQLRNRVSELKEKDARTAALRSECRELRVEIAGLVASSVHSESFEADSKSSCLSSLQAKRAEDPARPGKTCLDTAISPTIAPTSATRSLPGHVDGSTGSSCGPVPRPCGNHC